MTERRVVLTGASGYAGGRYAPWPVHAPIFRGMLREIARRAARERS